MKAQGHVRSVTEFALALGVIALIVAVLFDPFGMGRVAGVSLLVALAAFTEI